MLLWHSGSVWIEVLTNLTEYEYNINGIPAAQPVERGANNGKVVGSNPRECMYW